MPRSGMPPGLGPAEMAATHAVAFPHERPWSTTEFATLLAQDTCLAAGDARCFALVRVVADEAELLSIATDPTHRRQGLARTVMQAWMTEAAARGATRAFLEVAADNAAATALYQACGFVPCGQRRGYYRRVSRPPVDALLMARTLPQQQVGES